MYEIKLIKDLFFNLLKIRTLIIEKQKKFGIFKIFMKVLKFNL